MDSQSNRQFKKSFIETQFFIDDEYIGMAKTRNFVFYGFKQFIYNNKKYQLIDADREIRMYDGYTIVIDQINMSEYIDDYQKWSVIWSVNVPVLTK